MPRKNSAIDALQKLENDRAALDARQRELEVKAAQEIGHIILGSGLEKFSRKTLRELAVRLGKMGEETALARLAPDQNTKPPTSPSQTN